MRRAASEYSRLKTIHLCLYVLLLENPEVNIDMAFDLPWDDSLSDPNSNESKAISDPLMNEVGAR